MSMQVITIDGHAKTGKTSAGDLLVSELSREQNVRYAVAGHFFRRLTLVAAEKLNLPDDGSIVPTDTTEFKDAVDVALASGSANHERDWGSLDRPVIERLVHAAGEMATVQAAAEGWYADTIVRAMKDDVSVLVLDGRNPRNRVEEFVRSGQVVSTLDLFLDCDIEVAAKRSLAGAPRHIKMPSLSELDSEIVVLSDRRQRDMTRTENPMLLPPEPIIFEAHDDHYSTVRSAHGSHVEPGFPRTVLIDTSYTSRQDMCANVIALATHAINHTAIHALQQ